MARLTVAGWRPGELARQFGMSASQISVIQGSPLFMAEVARLEALADYEAVDVRVELEMRHQTSIEAIDRGLLNPDPAKAASVAFDVLDRTGYGKQEGTQKHQHLHLHKEIKEMSTEELTKVAMDMAKED
jgi:hypothetical protein